MPASASRRADIERRTPTRQFQGVSEHVLNDVRSAVGLEAMPPVVRRTFNMKTDGPPPTAQFMPSPSPVHPFEATRREALMEPLLPRRRPAWWRGALSLIPWFLGAGAVIAVLLYVSQYGFQMKGRVAQEGSAAIGHLLAARDSIERLDISTAQEQLQSAQSEFQRAERELNTLGPAVTKLLAKVPGLGSLGVAQNLLEIGRLLSESGTSLSTAMSALMRTGGAIEKGASDTESMQAVLEPLDAALTQANEKLRRARELTDAINPEDVPAEYREQFAELEAKLPLLDELIAKASHGVQFLRWFTGIDAPRRYLVLFANSSELRPTGGFPGSYGILTFEGGKLKDFQADDIYNPDGQIRTLVVPPLQLQHITPNWGMRDAAWWADFPTSAGKVREFWKLGGGTAVDGVLAVQPDVLADILRIIGPVHLDGYDMTLTPENVLPELQREVEYGIDKQKGTPKQVIADLAPVIVQRMAALRSEQWATLLGVLRARLSTRAIQITVDDADAQAFITGQAWDGRVLSEAGDYLQVNVANIKGAKADAVTDATLKLETWPEKGTLVHRLTFTRQHGGGESEYGFYNKTNYSWVRVLVPKGSVLRGVSGNDVPSNKPLMTYDAAAKRDADLEKLEQTYEIDTRWNATLFEESGKTGFGFWQTLQPGETKTVQLEYEIPASAATSDYSLLVQRQSGLRVSDFEFAFLREGGTRIEHAQPTLVEWPDSWRLHDDLVDDLRLSIGIR